MADGQSAHAYRRGRRAAAKAKPAAAGRKPHRGRVHPVYSDELAAEICERIAGDESLTSICAEKGISPASVYKWRNEKPHFRAALAQARIDQDETATDGLSDLRHLLRAQKIDAARATAEARIGLWEAGRRAGRSMIRNGEGVQRDDLSAYTDKELDALERIHLAARARRGAG